MPPRDPGPGYQALFAALPVAVIIVDPDDRIAHANALAEEMLHRSERAMLGRPIAEVLPLPEKERARGGYGLTAFDTDVTTARGSRIRVDLVEAELTDHPGWRAVTLHGAAGARAIGRAERHDGARAAIGAAAMLAHEIKNPLSGIRGAAQLLGPNELTRLIIVEVDRIAALIDRMEEFADDRPLPLGPENIYPLIGHARALAEAGSAHGARIEERFDPSLPAAQVNRDALLQVLINLLKNAQEALVGASDPRIVITTAYRHGIARAGPAGDRVGLPIEIAVIDNGPGAPDELTPLLFAPFVSGKPEGRGLGLALVDKLVRDMGGIVQYAREGAPPWTAFRLLLPRGTA